MPVTTHSLPKYGITDRAFSHDSGMFPSSRALVAAVDVLALEDSAFPQLKRPKVRYSGLGVPIEGFVLELLCKS